MSVDDVDNSNTTQPVSLPGDARQEHSPQTIRLVSPDQLREHAQAELVPDMRPDEFSALSADIRAHGITTPLEVLGDIVIDGRHRLRAARELGIAQIPVTDARLGGEGDVERMVKSAVLRRHLTDDQRAIIAARYAIANPRPRGGDRKSPAAKAKINQEHVGHFDFTAGRSGAAKMLNVSANRMKKALALLSAAPDLAKQVHQGALKLGQAQRSFGRAKQISRIGTTPLPEGLFRTIVVDPPWPYEDDGCRGAAEQVYPTMTFNQIRLLPIAERAGQEGHLFLWVPTPHLESAFAVLREWDFDYKTCVTWVKSKLGLGRYFRGCTEHVLFATRGNLPLREQNLKNWFFAPTGAHSAKPEMFYQLVERACFGPFLELFARQNRPGWFCWGADLEPIHQTNADVNFEEAAGEGEPR